MKKNFVIIYTILGIVVLTLGILVFIEYQKQQELKSVQDDVSTLKTTTESIQQDTNTLKKAYDAANPPTKDVSETDFSTILPSEIAAKSVTETLVIMIGRSDCGWCHRFIPVMEQASKDYHFNAKYIDLYSMIDTSTGQINDTTEYTTLINLPATEAHKEFLSKNFGATPLTIIVKNNTIVDTISGYVEQSTLNSVLESNGFTK